MTDQLTKDNAQTLIVAHNMMALKYEETCVGLARAVSDYLYDAGQMRAMALRGEPIPADLYRECLEKQEEWGRYRGILDGLNLGTNMLATAAAAMVRYPGDRFTLQSGPGGEFHLTRRALTDPDPEPVLPPDPDIVADTILESEPVVTP